MSRSWSTKEQPALFAGENRTQRMPAHMEPMCAKTAAIASTNPLETGVITSVSLFVLALSLSLLLLVSLLGLISLALSGLTGLVLVSLVGLLEWLVTRTTQGD